jgi:hypothetical protein
MAGSVPAPNNIMNKAPFIALPVIKAPVRAIYTNPQGSSPFSNPVVYRAAGWGFPRTLAKRALTPDINVLIAGWRDFPGKTSGNRRKTRIDKPSRMEIFCCQANHCRLLPNIPIARPNAP